MKTTTRRTPTRPLRGLPEEELNRQAEAAKSFIRRGGSLTRWFESKGFHPADEKRVRAMVRWGGR